MARNPVLERPSSLRAMGIALLAVVLFFVWLTWAFFSHTFTKYDDVKLTTTESGLALNKRADVKLRGMIVGIVREVHVENGQVVMTLGMDPKVIDRVPADVRAEIIPKTLFGEKYISLIPTGSGSAAHLQAGDTITDAKVPVEFEKFFNDIYPILTAVPPEKVAYTLTALANTLEGRGEEFGQTLEESNDYLKKLNPETQQSMDDIIDLGRVSDTYAGEMKEFGKLLRNSADLSRTVVDKKKDLRDLFDETDDLADVLRTFFEAAGDDIIATAHNSVKPLAVSREYSTMFPCWFKGQSALIDTRLDSTFRNNTLHISLFIVAPQATVYDVNTEHPVVPKESTIESLDITQPAIHGYVAGGYPKGLGTICDELYAAAAGHPRLHDNPIPIPGNLWKLVGIKNSHNGKLGTDADYNRPVPSSLDGIDSAAQRATLNQMTTALTGVKTENVPDVASLLISPVVRGAGVSIR